MGRAWDRSRICRDLNRLVQRPGAPWGMNKSKSPPKLHQPPLAAGQLWRMAETNLQVKTVGKMLVHYKLGKHDAIRVHISCERIDTIENYLRMNEAVLV
jgi:hypothetical protein